MYFNYKQIVTMNDLRNNTQSILAKLEEAGKLLVVDNDKPSFVISKLEEEENINKPNSTWDDSHPSQAPRGHIRRPPERDYILHGNICSHEEMHNALIVEEEALVTIYDEDGSSYKTVWRCANYSQKSSLDNNLGSGYLRNWREKGITKIRLEIK
jgi:hypothetical protein